MTPLAPDGGWLAGLLLVMLAALRAGRDEAVDPEALAHATLAAFHA